MDRLSVLCFGGTYGLALACDLARFVVRGTARWYATLALTTLAWVVQTAYLGNLTIEKNQLPVATVFESLLVLSWVLAAVALYLIIRSPKPVAVGVFLLPVILGLIVVAGFWAPREDWAGSGWGGASHFWGSAHGLLYLVGAVASCVAFAAGLMYLAQSDRLKHKRPPRFGFKLPSLEESERLNRGAITVAFPFLSAGLLVGLVMEAALRQAGQSRLSWGDPKIVSSVLVWLVFAGLLHARFRPEMRGRRVMLFTIVAFLCLAFATIGVNLMRITAHGVLQPSKKDAELGTRDRGLRYVGQGWPCQTIQTVGQAPIPLNEPHISTIEAFTTPSRLVGEGRGGGFRTTSGPRNWLVLDVARRAMSPHPNPPPQEGREPERWPQQPVLAQSTISGQALPNIETSVPPPGPESSVLSPFENGGGAS